MLLAAVFYILMAVGEAQERTLVHPRLLEERSIDGSMVVRIHDNLTLTLTKASVASEWVRLRTSRDGEALDQLVKASDIEKNMYENKNTMTTVFLFNDESGVKIEGLLNPTERIEPLQPVERAYSARNTHAIYKLHQNKILYDNVLRDAPGISERAYNNSRQPSEAEKLPQNVTIEIYVVSDTIHHKRFNSDDDVLRYICILFNSINAVFMSITSPAIKLLLVGLELTKDDGPYIFGNDELMYDDYSLDLFSKYVAPKKESYGTPDAIVLLTGRDMCTSTGGSVNKRVAGIAYVGGVCEEHNVAIAEDIGGSYSGVLETAHEVGHLLGATHDGSGPYSAIQAHPGSYDCPEKQGYLMSYHDGGEKRYRLSTCSQRQIKHVLRLRGKNCWNVVANKAYAIHNIYPGQLLSTKQYCQYLYPRFKSIYASTSDILNSHCKLKCCLLTRNGGRSTTACSVKVMLDGMPCGRMKKCFRGMCVSQYRLPTNTRRPWYSRQ
ncbi:venom metalloproteinase antarease-like TtrivMP_A isoform X2 [Haemaphysalis longicornis]